MDTTILVQERESRDRVLQRVSATGGGTFENLPPPFEGGTAGGTDIHGGGTTCVAARTHQGSRRDTTVNDIGKKKWRIAPKFLHFWT